MGIDTASIDYGQSTLYEVHRTLFRRNIPAFENLTALELPALRVCGGASDEDWAEAALRAIAILP